MSFTYRAGATTANLAGLVEIGSIRISGVSDGTYDGTFELHRLGGILDGSPPVRPAAFPLGSDHGDFAGTPFYEAREILIEGLLQVPTLADIWGAKDLLEQTFNLNSTALKTLTVKTSGWSAARQILVRISGPVSYVEPEGMAKLLPERLFSVPLIAPDPRLYAVTQQDVTISGATSLTNNGTIGAPLIAQFIGPQTAPCRVTAPDGSYIEYNANIASGRTIFVNTRDSTTGTTTVYDDLGATQYANLTKASAALIPSGTSSWTKSNGGGAGATHILFYDAWA